jgi:tryptophan-rich sensory protein
VSPVAWEALLILGGLGGWLAWEAAIERRRERRRRNANTRPDA